MGLSCSQLHEGAYALLLAEESGPRRIPVVIGESEAQSIALALERIVTPRPLTHDLFVTFAHAFGVRLTDVFISRFEDGIFYSQLTFQDESGHTVTTDARTSDAVALAIRTHTPIYTTEEVLEQTGFVLQDSALTPVSDAEDLEQDEDYDDIQEDIDSYHAEPRLENYSIEQLEKSMADCIANEDYEQAQAIMLILERKKGNNQ